MKNIIDNILILFMLLIFNFTIGCSFQKLEEDLAEQESLVIIEGEVQSENTDSTSPIIIGLITANAQQPTLVNHKTLDQPDTFRISAFPGKYKIFAFEDANKDQHYQESEYISEIVPLDNLKSGTPLQVTLLIKEETAERIQQQAKDIKSKVRQGQQSKLVTPGTIISLDSPNFSQENIEMGLWQPLQFVKTVPFGLYYLKKYDKKKIPVLFVHGVSGSPAEFKPLIDNLDSQKYQPIVFYYPSGFPISFVGEALQDQIEEAYSRYTFKELVVVAHSMGGLVTRSFINDYSQSNKSFLINKYITISTPWGGHEAAAMGLKYAPAIIPVWNDIVPGSIFLNSILKTPLPEHTNHYLLFGYKGESNFIDGNSDGVVSIAAQLKIQVQDEAVQVKGFDDNHNSILLSKQVVTTVNEILSN